MKSERSVWTVGRRPPGQCYHSLCDRPAFLMLMCAATIVCCPDVVAGWSVPEDCTPDLDIIQISSRYHPCLATEIRRLVPPALWPPRLVTQRFLRKRGSSGTLLRIYTVDMRRVPKGACTPRRRSFIVGGRERTTSILCAWYNTTSTC